MYAALFDRLHDRTSQCSRIGYYDTAKANVDNFLASIVSAVNEVDEIDWRFPLLGRNVGVVQKPIACGGLAIAVQSSMRD